MVFCTWYSKSQTVAKHHIPVLKRALVYRTAYIQVPVPMDIVIYLVSPSSFTWCHLCYLLDDTFVIYLVSPLSFTWCHYVFAEWICSRDIFDWDQQLLWKYFYDLYLTESMFPSCHSQVFRVPITEEFIEFCSDGALSIEVWGHRSYGFGQMLTVADTAQAKSRSVTDRSGWNGFFFKHVNNLV